MTFIRTSKLLFSSILITAVVISIFSIGYSEDVKEHFTTIQEAKNKGFFERGWLPSILPPSTSNIDATHDLDIDRSKGEFSIGSQDWSIFINSLNYQNKEETPVNIIYATYIQGEYIWKFTCNQIDKSCTYIMQKNR